MFLTASYAMARRREQRLAGPKPSLMLWRSPIAGTDQARHTLEKKRLPTPLVDSICARLAPLSLLLLDLQSRSALYLELAQ